MNNQADDPSVSLTQSEKYYPVDILIRLLPLENNKIVLYVLRSFLWSLNLVENCKQNKKTKLVK